MAFSCLAEIALELRRDSLTPREIAELEAAVRYQRKLNAIFGEPWWNRPVSKESNTEPPE